MNAPEQINLYIAEQPEWQRKLLVRVRQLVHPVDENIEECWKASAPHFELGDRCIGMHALKTCVSVWFPKGAALKDSHGLFQPSEKDNERELRKYKLHEGDAINEKAFVDLVQQYFKQSKARPAESESKPQRKVLELPAELEQVLTNDGDAQSKWTKLAPSHKREYVEWITDAKQDETRKRRIAKALEMIREGRTQGDIQKVG